jgi:predicted alpha/beta-hydrolase family hydrolase
MTDVETPSGLAQYELDRPSKPRALLLIGHGAGGGVDAPDILAARKACHAAHIAVAAVLQPYRVAGRRTPPPPKTLDPAWLTVVSAVRAERGMRALPLFVAGRSSGARVACRTATDAGAAGVVALAFPLHPPGKPESTRLAELLLPIVPTLVVQGDRDAFGMPPEDACTVRVVIEGADHGLKLELPRIGASVVEFVDRVLAGEFTSSR